MHPTGMHSCYTLTWITQSLGFNTIYRGLSEVRGPFKLKILSKVFKYVKLQQKILHSEYSMIVIYFKTISLLINFHYQHSKFGSRKIKRHLWSSSLYTKDTVQFRQPFLHWYKNIGDNSKAKYHLIDMLAHSCAVKSLGSRHIC